MCVCEQSKREREQFSCLAGYLYTLMNMLIQSEGCIFQLKSIVFLGLSDSAYYIKLILTPYNSFVVSIFQHKSKNVLLSYYFPLFVIYSYWESYKSVE